MRKSVLILGGTGLVGSYISTGLKKDNYEVFTTSSSGSNADFPYDINSGSLAVFQQKKFDIVINCIVSYSGALEESINRNALALLPVLQQLSDVGSHFIHISSISAYSDNKYTNEYSLSKAISDELVLFFEKKQMQKVTVLRFPQLFDKKGHARKSQPGLYFFVDAIKNKQPVTLYGDGALRSYFPAELAGPLIDYVIKNNIYGLHHVIPEEKFTTDELLNVLMKNRDYDRQLLSVDKNKKAATYLIPEPSDVLKTFFDSHPGCHHFLSQLVTHGEES